MDPCILVTLSHLPKLNSILDMNECKGKMLFFPLAFIAPECQSKYSRCFFILMDRLAQTNSFEKWKNSDEILKKCLPLTKSRLSPMPLEKLPSTTQRTNQRLRKEKSKQ